MTLNTRTFVQRASLSVSCGNSISHNVFTTHFHNRQSLSRELSRCDKRPFALQRTRSSILQGIVPLMFSESSAAFTHNEYHQRIAPQHLHDLDEKAIPKSGRTSLPLDAKRSDNLLRSAHWCGMPTKQVSAFPNLSFSQASGRSTQCPVHSYEKSQTAMADVSYSR